MTFICSILLEFKLDTEADSQSDAEYDIAMFIKNHIMEDEDTNPIVWKDIKIQHANS